MAFHVEHLSEKKPGRCKCLAGFHLLRGIKHLVYTCLHGVPIPIQKGAQMNTAPRSTDATAYEAARRHAQRMAAYLWELAQHNPAMRERCRRFGINPDAPLGPQIGLPSYGANQ